MDGVALRSSLAGRRFSDVRVVDSIDSTNRALLAWAIAGHDDAGNVVADGAVLIARSQTAGRGRLGRTWIAPPDSALLMTVLVDPEAMPIERWPLLSFAMGIAVVDCVTGSRVDVSRVDVSRVDVSGVDVSGVVSLKWPNDVVVTDVTAPFGYRKLAGILAESRVGEDRPFVVVGIGINLVRPAHLDPALGPDAVPTWLEDHWPLGSRESFTADVLIAFEGAVSILADDPSAFIARYRSVCSTLGRVVAVELGGRRVVGTAVDVDQSGHLIVDEASGEATERHVLTAGDVVHLRPAV